MKVKLMDFEKAQEIAKISKWDATTHTIVGIPRFAWNELSGDYYPACSSDQQGVIEIDDGGILNWSVPICFIGDIRSEEEPEKISSIRDMKILVVYKDLKDRRDRACAMWCKVEDDADHPSPEYVMYKGARQEIRGFLTALELMGFDMEALAAVTEED